MRPQTILGFLIVYLLALSILPLPYFYDQCTCPQVNGVTQTEQCVCASLTGWFYGLDYVYESYTVHHSLHGFFETHHITQTYIILWAFAQALVAGIIVLIYSILKKSY